MTLRATRRSSLVSRARYTVAMPPWPISPMISYFPRRLSMDVSKVVLRSTRPRARQDTGRRLLAWPAAEVGRNPALRGVVAQDGRVTARKYADFSRVGGV